MAKILDAHLATRPFVAGERFSMGDIAAGAAGHRWLHLAPNRTRLPHVERWYAALIARPAASKALTAPLT